MEKFKNISHPHLNFLKISHICQNYPPLPDSDSTDVERRSYQKIVDAYGILGVLAITKDEAVLVAVTGVLSVGQLYGADILKITNVEFISLRTFGSVENVDSRIIDVSFLNNLLKFLKNLSDTLKKIQKK